MKKLSKDQANETISEMNQTVNSKMNRSGNVATIMSQNKPVNADPVAIRQWGAANRQAMQSPSDQTMQKT